MVGQSKSIEKIGKFVIGLPPLTLPVAVNPSFEILDALLGLILIKTFLTNEQISRASFPIILVHHYIAYRLL